MIQDGDRLVVGVSGGPDSVALTYALWRLSSRLGIELHLAHLNHMFRAQEAEEDALAVSTLARKLDLPLTIESFDVPAFLNRSGLSQQDGARQVRYSFLRRVGSQCQAQKIATGHNADDVAETVLMRLLSGSGASGLASIPPVNGDVIRPLIETERREIESYLNENRLPYRLDSTNLKPHYLRNRIRLKLLPLLRSEYNPNVNRALIDLAHILRDEDVYLNGIVDGLLPTLCFWQGEEVALNPSAYLGYQPAVRRRVLREILFRLKGDRMGIGFHHIERLHDFISGSRTGAIMELPGGLVAERGAEGILFYPPSQPQPPVKMELTVPGEVAIPNLGFSLRATLQHTPPNFDLASLLEELKEEPDVAYLDYAKIELPLTVCNRSSLAGCKVRFQPLGMRGRKSLKEYLIDRKIPRRRREVIPLIMSGEELVWVGGHQIDDRVKLDKGTSVMLRIDLRPI